MNLVFYYEPEFGSLKELLLDMTQERSTEIFLKMIVDTLVERPRVAMARIWITRPGDACHACPMVSGCPDQSSCCHLAAIEKKNPHEAKKLMEEGIIDVREKLKGYKKKRGSNPTRTQVTIQLQYHVLM